MRYILRAFWAPIFFCLFFTFYPAFSFANVSEIVKIVFTEESAVSVATGELSKIITVQARNALEASEPMEISGGKLSLISSSQSGEFYTSPTSLEKIIAPLTVNSSWTGRNFYYKNSQSGLDTLTAVLNVSGKTFSVSQTINVGSSTTISTSTSLSEDNLLFDVKTQTAVEELTFLETDSVETFPVGAGRERFAYAGTSVLFKANYKQLKSLGNNKKFIWNFGDGYEGQGEEVYHSYKHTGEYNVVLNASAGDAHGTSRTKVTVLEPNLKMNVSLDESISLENIGNYEINIGNLKLKSYYREYRFPEDTIIGVGKKIVFDKECTGLLVTNNEVVLLDIENQELLSFKPTKGEIKQIPQDDQSSFRGVGEEDIVDIGEANKLISILNSINKKDMTNKESLASQETPFNLDSSEINNSSNEFSDKIVEENSSENEPKKASFWQKIVFFPATVFWGVVDTFYKVN